MIIAIANQKGGVSKTTTAAALACALRESGKKVLAIDADPQGSLSFILGADMNAPGLLEVLQGEINLADAVQHTEQADILPGSVRFATAAAKLQADALKKALAPYRNKYRYFVIDSGPGISGALMQALIAADTVIIPTIADAGSLLGLRNMRDTIRTAESFGDTKKKCCALITQANSRKTNAEKAIEEAMRTTCAELGIPVYRTQIRKADAVRASAGFRESIITYDPKSKPAADYMTLLHEMKLL